MKIFDYDGLAHKQSLYVKELPKHSQIYELVAESIIERLGLFQKTYKSILVIEDRSNLLYDSLLKYDASITYAFLDSKSFLKTNADKVIISYDHLPFTKNSFDLVISFANIHHINDVQGYFIQIKNILRENGIAMFSGFGENTLTELRKIMAEAETILYNGISPHIFPFIDVKSLGNLMQKAGFLLPVSDVESHELLFSNCKSLFNCMKYSGNGNIMLQRSSKYFTKIFFSLIESLYMQKYFCRSENDDTIKIYATLDILYATCIKE